jgi:hypothetical protein
MPIKDTATFAEECVRQGLFLGVNPHYLLAAAMLRSGIKDDVDDSRVGPYRVTQALWDANGSASDLEVVLDSVDIEDWRLTRTTINRSDQAQYSWHSRDRRRRNLLPAPLQVWVRRK